MPFVLIPDMPGKLFVPEQQDDSKKKYPCKDCSSCLHCSDERCALCLKRCGDCKAGNSNEEK